MVKKLYSKRGGRITKKTIDVTRIDLVEKDVIYLKNLKDMKELQTALKFKQMWKLGDKYYLIGSEVAYVYDTNGKNNIEIKEVLLCH